MTEASQNLGCSAGQRLGGGRLDCNLPSDQRVQMNCVAPGSTPYSIPDADMLTCAASQGISVSAAGNAPPVGNGTGAVAAGVGPMNVLTMANVQLAGLTAAASALESSIANLRVAIAQKDTQIAQATTVLAATTDPVEIEDRTSQLRNLQAERDRLFVREQSELSKANLVAADIAATTKFIETSQAILATNPSASPLTLIALAPKSVVSELIQDGQIDTGYQYTNPATGQTEVLNGAPAESVLGYVESTSNNVNTSNNTVIITDDGVPQGGGGQTPPPIEPPVETNYCDGLCAVAEGSEMCALCVATLPPDNLCEPRFECCNGIGVCEASVPTPTPQPEPQLTPDTQIASPPPIGVPDTFFTRQDYLDYMLNIN